MNLVIVESPTKGRTIEKFLEGDFEVVACFGHVRDLPKKELGIDIQKDFEPTYLIVPQARKVLKTLKEKIKPAQVIYLATDYDREGEAIAWHLIKALRLEELKTKSQVQRITFHEITKPAIRESLKKPRGIDLNLVDAQQARRILDRLVGYKLSPFLWRKVARGLSAGRVQSVTVRLVAEREKEIRNFKPQEYWQIKAIFSKNQQSFEAILAKIEGRKIDKLEIKSSKEAQKYLDDLKGAEYKVLSQKKEVKKRYPFPPYTTSTLQQEAAINLHFAARQTMRLAQNLYEKGLITYMRTDSVQVSPLALGMAKKVIEEEFGPNYALLKPRIYKTKTKGAQEAHEAIRPTNLRTLPPKVNLEAPQARLYELIWKRMIASQMKEAEIIEESVEIGTPQYIFLASGSEVKFDGFLKLYRPSSKEENTLPALEEGEIVKLEKLEKTEHFTEPPGRYSEATLIKELEKRGIGRPSTYAPTLSTIMERGYVEKVQGKLIPQEMGEIVSDLLVQHFPEIVDYDFTAKMEEELDEIAEGKLKWRQVLADFYQPFAQNLKAKTEEVSRKEITEEKTDEKCPECGQPLKIKLGRYGKFLACSGFPKCKYTRPIVDLEKKGKSPEVKEKCPKCQKNLILKEGKFGPFLACEGYPSCKYTRNLEIAAQVPCPVCGGKILRRTTRKGKTFWGCGNFPRCKKAFWEEPIAQKCPACQGILLKSKNMLKCSQCDWKENANL